MIFRSWFAIENFDYTQFLLGNFGQYHSLVEKQATTYTQALLLGDYYTQVADFEKAQDYIHALIFSAETDTDYAEYALSYMFLQNRMGDIHGAGHTFEDFKKYAKKHSEPEFWFYYQLVGSNVYFRKGKVQKAYKMLQKVVKKKPDNPILNILIYLSLSEYVLYLGKFLQAKDFFKQAKYFLALNKAEYYIFLPVFHRHQALLARSSFDIEKAKVHLENALGLNLNLYGKQHGDVASAYCEKAIIALQQGNYEEMNHLNLFSEKIRKFLYPENNAELSQNHALRAVYTGMQGNTQDAVLMYGQAHEMLKKSTWVRNPNLLGLEFSKAVFEAEQGNPELSLKKMTRILTETRKIRGKNFTELAPANVFMAEAHMAMGDLFEARKHLVEAFRICGETAGETNIIYADCLKIYGRLYVYEEQNAKAERAYIDALNLLSAINQRNTIRFTVILQALSELYKNVGETQKSIHYLEKCVKIVEKIPHSSSLQILSLYLQLSDAYAEIKPSKAESYFETLAQIGKDLPHDHPAHVSILKTASNVKLHRKKYQEALNYAKTITQLLTLKKDFDNPIYEETELQIGDLLLITKQFERCIKRAKSLLTQRESAYFQYEMTLKLIRALRQKQDFEEAENTCRIYLNRHAEMNDLSDFYVELALVYSGTKQFILAKKYFEEAISNLNRVAGANSYRHLEVLESYKKLSKIMKDNQLEVAIDDKLIEIRANHLN